jgi:hypothetical protein
VRGRDRKLPANKTMTRRFAGMILACAIASPAAHAAKEMTTLRVVVNDRSGEPVPRASVIVRRLKGKDLKKIAESLQLRTSQEGTAPLPPIEQGFVLIQVIAEGFQTYAGRVELKQPEQTETITLSPPQKQHSVHKN